MDNVTALGSNPELLISVESEGVPFALNWPVSLLPLASYWMFGDNCLSLRIRSTLFLSLGSSVRSLTFQQMCVQMPATLSGASLAQLLLLNVY